MHGGSEFIPWDTSIWRISALCVMKAMIRRPNSTPKRVPVYAVMRPERQRLRKLRACIEWWGEWVGGSQ